MPLSTKDYCDLISEEELHCWQSQLSKETAISKDFLMYLQYLSHAMGAESLAMDVFLLGHYSSHPRGKQLQSIAR